MDEVLLTIAIPTYNRKEDIFKALRAIEKQLTNSIEVIVSDNASTDGTQELIRNYFPWVSYYKNENNMGADFNFLNCYRLSKGKYVWLLGSDDVIQDNAIDTIVSFIKKNSESIDLIYLNHFIYKEETNGDITLIKKYIDDDSNLLTTNRNEFIRIAKARITFMSCMVIRRSNFMLIDNPERYCNTSFLHTCIIFECAKKNNCVFGVIGKLCVGANATYGSAGLDRDICRYLEVFSKKMKYVLCNVAVQFQFDKNTMNSIFINEIYHSMSRRILKSKVDDINISYVFWNSVFPCIKQYPIAWFTIIPSFFVPKSIAKFSYHYIKPILKKIMKGNIICKGNK